VWGLTRDLDAPREPTVAARAPVAARGATE